MADRETPRLTESRRVILEQLRVNGSHPTAEEMHCHVRERLPRISLATVYRNLDYLARHGLVATLRDAEGRRRYDASPDDHCHVWCVECGRVEDVYVSSDACLEGLMDDDMGFEVTGHRLTFLGRCPMCRRRAEGSTGRT
jgi:Fur family ferric uptake transcriptional regulator